MNTTQPDHYQAHTIGSIAGEVLDETQTAALMGITSRGVFIKTERPWIIFLTNEQMRGPMTINMRSRLPRLDERSTGGLVQITPGLITVPEAGLAITTAEAGVWQPEPPSYTAYQPAACQARLKTFGAAAYAHKGGTGLSDVLLDLLDIAGDAVGTTPTPQVFKATIIRIQRGFERADIPATIQHLHTILGRGLGLTPSGDDFVIGALLALSRWQEALELDGEWPSFSAQVVEVAYKLTTTLSANLIECAARGLADERLISALDYLMTGRGNQTQVLEELLNWGNSSGVDALVGMASALFAESAPNPDQHAP